MRWELRCAMALSKDKGGGSIRARNLYTGTVNASQRSAAISKALTIGRSGGTRRQLIAEKTTDAGTGNDETRSNRAGRHSNTL
jgi:hypothetical protein